jgi:hypothetical protein
MQSPGIANPPPLPQPTSFFIGVNDKQTGPFDMPTLQSMLQQGQITRDTLVWKNGMPAWTKAGETPELHSLFAGSPPPLPT